MNPLSSLDFGLLNRRWCSSYTFKREVIGCGQVICRIFTTPVRNLHFTA